jgi:hypothetical protein
LKQSLVVHNSSMRCAVEVAGAGARGSG